MRLEGELVSSPVSGEGGRPDPLCVRGRCPECGDELVSNLYYIGGKGYLMIWECWSSLASVAGDGDRHVGEEPRRCQYRRVL